MVRNLIVLPEGREVFSGKPGVAIMECTLTRTVNSGEELTAGSVCSAMLEFDLIHPSAVNLTAGQEVTLFHVEENGRRHKVGIFRLEKPVRTGTERCRVTAYDRVSKLDKDLTGWLNNRTWDCTLQEFAQQVADQCGLTLSGGDIPNGSLTVNPFTVGEVTGRQLMKWIGEAAGCFCRATPTGELELSWYTPSGVTLAPGVTEPAIIQEKGGNVTVSSRSVKTVDDNRGDVALTAPVLSLTPVDEAHAALDAVEQSVQIPWFLEELELGGYQVTPVEAVQLQLSGGILWPEAKDGANAYIISGNPILNRTTQDVQNALAVILNRLAAVGGYTPCKVSIPAGDIQPGSILTLTDTWGNTHSLPVMSVTRAGQKDILECTGEHRRDSSAAKNNKSPDQIAQEKVDGLTQADIFNKLTDGGKLQGLYIQDGKLYINAEFVKILGLVANSITSGRLNSVDGETYFDLDHGVIKSAIKNGGYVEIFGDSISGYDKKDTLRFGIWRYVNGPNEIGYGVFLKDAKSKTVGELCEEDGVLVLGCKDENDIYRKYKVRWQDVGGVKCLAAYE